MHEFRYDYVKPKYGENSKRCDMDTESFIAPVKTDYIYNNEEDNKAKGTKKCVIKRKLKFQYYKNCLEAQVDNKTNHLGKKNVNVNVNLCKL